MLNNMPVFLKGDATPGEKKQFVRATAAYEFLHSDLPTTAATTDLLLFPSISGRAASDRTRAWEEGKGPFIFVSTYI